MGKINSPSFLIIVFGIAIVLSCLQTCCWTQGSWKVRRQDATFKRLNPSPWNSLLFPWRAAIFSSGKNSPSTGGSGTDASGRASFGLGPFLPMVATAELVPNNNVVRGTIRLTQQTMYSNVFISGVINGLTAHQLVNVHVRQFGDVSANCAKQGNVYNGNQIETGGYLVLETEAETGGILSLNHSTPAVRASLWGPGFRSIIGRSLRISLGAENAKLGAVLACGRIVAKASGPHTINAETAPGVVVEPAEGLGAAEGAVGTGGEEVAAAGTAGAEQGAAGSGAGGGAAGSRAEGGAAGSGTGGGAAGSGTGAGSSGTGGGGRAGAAGSGTRAGARAAGFGARGAAGSGAGGAAGSAGTGREAVSGLYEDSRF